MERISIPAMAKSQRRQRPAIARTNAPILRRACSLIIRSQIFSKIFKKTVLYAASLDIGNMGYGKLGRMTPQEIVQQTNNYYREKEKADEMFKKISPYANFGKKPSLAETKILVKAYFDVRLKDPSSARITYSNKWLKSYALHNGKVIFCWEMSGAVNAKNSFGAYVGNKQF